MMIVCAFQGGPYILLSIQSTYINTHDSIAYTLESTWLNWIVMYVYSGKDGNGIHVYQS